MVIGTLKSIAYKPKEAKVNPQQVGYTRQLLNEALLIENYGIEHDRKGGNPKRNLNVMDDLTLNELARDGYPTEPAHLGENLIIAGIDLRALEKGTQLRIGTEAVIEIGKLREPCEQLTELDERMPENVVGRVGMMCRVAKGGRIKVGDVVEVVREAVQQA